MILRLAALAAVAFAAGNWAAPVLAADEVNVGPGLTLAGAPLAIRGVDPVALATLNAVAPGEAVRTVVHAGVAYYFASALTAEAFEAAPEKYLPRYGGFCAFAVALGKKLDGDPRYADIVDGRLYLFVDAGIFARYLENPREILAKAEAAWPSIEHQAADSL
ncbi:MAG: YHS domain-containing (seleno)protein [Albimonas sp.]|uniref:YHS domain-containing (seleno)protein n=1 Tax=Albimonas sp. TaxID=1872425 RepID=UPI0040568046|tara:strand:- start:321 stop:806 length:486 start_codon:yes stop_codon:yes gene_type:complete